MSTLFRVEHELDKLEESIKVLIIFVALLIPGKEVQRFPKMTLNLKSTVYPNGFIIKYNKSNRHS